VVIVPVPAIFTAIAVIFMALVLRDLLLAEGKLDARRRTWLRLAVIFAAIAVALEIARTFRP
jgi:hypothetical protein